MRIGRPVRAACAAVVLALAVCGCSTAQTGGPSDRIRVTEATVARVVDGDTLVLTGGERVRLIGIDAPETGDCGAAEATALLARLVEGQDVAVGNPASVQDRDRHGRLLAFIAVPGRVDDAGARLLREGLAVPRYNSTDGYDEHPRERSYARDAAGAVPFSCGATPTQR